MNWIKIATSSINQTPLDWTGNLQRIQDVITDAKSQNVSILCLPELAITGYGCEDQFLAEYVCEKAWENLLTITENTANIAVAVGLPLRFQNAIWNAVALVTDKKIAGFYLKQNLAGDGIHYEPRWFKAWPEGVVSEITIDDKVYSIGDLSFDLSGVKIGFEICEDAWVADRPGRRAAEHGCDLILNPSASHFAFGKQKIRRQFVQEGSRAFACAYLYANLMGNEAGRAIYDGGAMIAHQGGILSEGTRLSFHDSELITATIDLSLHRLQQAKTVSNQPNINPANTFECHLNWVAKNCLPEAPKQHIHKLSKEEEFTRAVCLGLFDYMRKSYTCGFVVSLSGGADSAAVVCLVTLMEKLARAELGEQRFRDKLHYWKKTPHTKNLLFTAYQKTENSGKTTESAARTLADAIGAEFHIWDVDPILKQYHTLAEKALGRPLNWDSDDITLQNIQARVRAPSIWMMANVKNALLLATSNRSEAAVGYATMDGDTCGSLSPIAGIDKAFLRHWLRWLEKTGSETVQPIPELSVINNQQPTAELRPQDENQTDEDDLMPYPILDQIERYAIRDKKSPQEILELLHFLKPEATKETRIFWVKRFFTLWSRNQWKRERYAPSFHLDDENLDPKTWCRFPILSGGFAEELNALETP